MFGNRDQLMTRVVWKLAYRLHFRYRLRWRIGLSRDCAYNALRAGLRKGALPTSTDAGALQTRKIPLQDGSGRAANSIDLSGAPLEKCFRNRPDAFRAPCCDGLSPGDHHCNV
jgi:hypothetical protein